jgi:pyruvate dehydrogenase E1 component alpha subunit
VATGLALADVYLEKDAITICMMGDGATNIGFFHEGINMAKVWDLPVLWVVENNQYGMGTAVSRASAVPEIRTKASGYGMKAESADGMDLLAVYETTARMLAEIRGGSGPQMLELMTYRFRGHSMGDPERYRKQEEVHKWQEEDPIGIFRRKLIDMKVASEQELDEQDDIAEREVEEAVQFAESSPEPAPEELYTDVYAEPFE